MKSINISLAIVLIVLIAAGVSLAGSDGGGARVGFISVFSLCAMLAFVINWVMFIPSNAAKSEHYYDLTGSVTYLLVIISAVLLTPWVDARGKLVAIMVVVWAIRLGSFLFLRIRNQGSDDRFDVIKVEPLRFFLAWSLQALWVVLTTACALAIITGGNQAPIGIVGLLGVVVWIVGFLIEVIADAQKRAFRRNPDNAQRFINQGLWSWSRHPNYFGEIVLWCGIALIAVPILTGWQWLTLVSPLFVYLLLTRVSGIPTLSKKAQERWGNDAEYQAYVARTALLIPRPPSS